MHGCCDTNDSMSDDIGDGPSISLTHALERLMALRRIAVDALAAGDVSRAQAALERAAEIERELEAMIGVQSPT